MTAVLDLDEARAVSPSFDKLWREVERLVASAIGGVPIAVTPSSEQSTRVTPNARAIGWRYSSLSLATGMGPPLCQQHGTTFSPHRPARTDDRPE
jgi:hypothetical protein